MEKDIGRYVRDCPYNRHSLQLRIKGSRRTGEDDGCVLSSADLSGY